MSHANPSEAVRKVIATADHNEDVQDVIERARAALLDAHAVSLFALETPHPEFGAVHWIVGRAQGETPGYVVLAIAERPDADHDWPIFSAASDDLADAFRQLIPDCGANLPVPEFAGVA